jgi:hypothetical protein
MGIKSFIMSMEKTHSSRLILHVTSQSWWIKKMTKTDDLDPVGFGFTFGSDPSYPINIYYLYKNTLLKRKNKTNI